MLGEKIYKLRKEKQISQETLAQILNVSRQTISNWETGETSPNPEQLKILSKELNISIDELLDNNISNKIIEKISNTEKLASLLLKTIKVIGVILLLIIIIDIISLIIFSYNKQDYIEEYQEELIN